MKLKNKKTGEIGYLYEHSLVQDIIIVYDVKGIVGKYNSLAELNEEWEDYEEPKGMKDVYVSGFCKNGVMIEFETKEEAEKAVEKLKAWKRLKDKGFRFTNWEFRDVLDGNLVIEAKLNFDNSNKIQRNLEICFGGEE